MERFKVVKGSESAHCCFAATVVDTLKPHPCYPDMFDWVCECFNEADAERIAKALNLTEEQQS